VTENATDSMYVVQSAMLHVFVNSMGPDNLVRTMSRGQIVSPPSLAYRVREPVTNIEPNTKHAVRATQVERQVEMKAYTHDTDS